MQAKPEVLSIPSLLSVQGGDCLEFKQRQQCTSYKRESLSLCGETLLGAATPRPMRVFSYLSVTHIAVTGEAETGCPLARLWDGWQL